MNADNNQKAVILYVPPKQNKLRDLRNYTSRINSILYVYFKNRRKLILSATILFALMLFAGNCTAAHYLFKLPYILDVFFDKYFTKTFLFAYSFIFASGYTIFGSVLSVCFFALFSFFIGNLSYVFFIYDTFNLNSFFFLLSIVAIAFFLTVFCCDSFSFYSLNKSSKKFLFSKHSLAYFLSSILIFNISFILFTLILNYFW